VSSIFDGGVGQYTVNFTISMQDTNYAVAGSAGNIITDEILSVKALLTNYCSIDTIGTGGTSRVDSTYVSVAIFR
jgi:hypothetical protein